MNYSTLEQISDEGLFKDGDWIESKDQDKNGKIRLLQLADIGIGNFINKSSKFINEETYKRLKCNQILKGDILIARMPDPIGRSCVFPVEDDFKYITAVDVAILRVNKDVNNRYVCYMLNSPTLLNESLMQSTGATRKRISRKKLSKFKIPLPKLESQKKTAAILDEADKVRQLNKQLIEKYDALTQSLFLDMFGDPVTNPKGWETRTIEDIIKKEKYSLKRGPFGGALKKEIFVKKGYLVYEQYHALNNDFSFKRYFIDDKKFDELKAFEVKPRDLIISCSGVYLGKLAMIPENADRGIINQALLKVTLDEEKMRNDFFIFHFTQKRFRQTFFDANRGAGVPNFPPMKEFKQFPFICPSIKLQNQFAERVQIIENQKQQAQEALQKSEDLFNSLLQKAFKGELVKA